jgi:cobyrinic acid a,c-diamide synthase
MRQLPRVAIGSLTPNADRHPLVWALLAALHAAGCELAHFHSTTRLSMHDAARSLTGTGSRHLDSWAMSRAACLRTLVRAGSAAGLAIIEGDFRPATASMAADGGTNGPATTSSLHTLSDWLDASQIAIVQADLLDPCVPPPRPKHLDGLLLDRVIDDRHAAHWQTNLEALWGVPVLGWLDRAESLRSLCRSLPAGRDPSPDLCAALGRRLLTNLQLDKLLALADRNPLPPLPADDLLFDSGSERLRIAIAYDEEFCGYFPDTLELLEEAGAELCDFSPLRSGCLPDGADVVYFGCGHPERQPDALAKNHCLRQSLREFAAAGGRIYGEGGGLAYLCREIQLGPADAPAASRFPMTGLLPAVARLVFEPAEPQPVELTFATGSWLVEAGDYFRGYRHPGWTIAPQGPMVSYAQAPDQRLDVLGRGNVVGSRVWVNLAANEHLLRRFLAPAVPAGGSVRRGF